MSFKNLDLGDEPLEVRIKRERTEIPSSMKVNLIAQNNNQTSIYKGEANELHFFDADSGLIVVGRPLIISRYGEDLKSENQWRVIEGKTPSEWIRYFSEQDLDYNSFTSTCRSREGPFLNPSIFSQMLADLGEEIRPFYEREVRRLEEIRAGENLLKSWGYIQNECR